ncbi:MAG TPA: hypothetical protein VFB37_12405 [Steroidobacteraceae bacterium]|nr:hypothetical protein [Steroidobacteraceae bacterium]
MTDLPVEEPLGVETPQMREPAAEVALEIPAPTRAVDPSPTLETFEAEELLAHGVLLDGAAALAAASPAPAQTISAAPVVTAPVLAPAPTAPNVPAAASSAAMPAALPGANPPTPAALGAAPVAIPPVAPPVLSPRPTSMPVGPIPAPARPVTGARAEPPSMPIARPPPVIPVRVSAMAAPSASATPPALQAAVLSHPVAATAAMPAPALPSSMAGGVTTASLASSAGSSATTGAMDRDFIARNQIVERYLSGRLPLKGATDFERFCRDNPQLLDELGLAERVNAGLRLLEASGKPDPWQEAPKSAWTKPQFVLGLAAVVLALSVALAVVGSSSATKSQKIVRLQRQVAEQPLDPATSTRTIRLVPSHDGASNTPAVVIGGGPAQLVDLKIDESRSAYKTFQITIDRIDQGRVAILRNLVKDSNGHLRIALNSSALGPGNYQLTIEGLSWRGDPEPDAWITIGIQR